MADLKLQRECKNLSLNAACALIILIADNAHINYARIRIRRFYALIMKMPEAAFLTVNAEIIFIQSNSVSEESFWKKVTEKAMPHHAGRTSLLIN